MLCMFLPSYLFSFDGFIERLAGMAFCSASASTASHNATANRHTTKRVDVGGTSEGCFMFTSRELSDDSGVTANGVDISRAFDGRLVFAVG